MTTRHLATIERIADIRSIPDADAIEAVWFAAGLSW